MLKFVGMIFVMLLSSVLEVSASPVRPLYVKRGSPIQFSISK